MGAPSNALAKPRRRRAIIVLLAPLIALAPTAVTPPAAAAAGLPDVKCQNATHATVCVINRPTVNQPLTYYDQVHFAPGDRVHVHAGGCVQTGGAGATWKRYVAPLDGHGLYYGTVHIPYATLQPVGLIWSNDLDFTVPFTGIDPSQLSQLYLRLGYVDDDYDNNGYWGHDDGTQDQCKNEGNAFVLLTIKHGSVQPAPDPLDLVWDKVDLNGIPFNPRWGWQVGANADTPLPSHDLGQFSCWNGTPQRPRGFDPPCTRQVPDFDTEPTCAGVGGPFPGHINWGPTTYQGRLNWKDWSSGGEDDDYNLRLTGPIRVTGRQTVNGLTESNNGALDMEFDSDETVDHWTTRWWSKFHEAVQDDNNLLPFLHNKEDRWQKSRLLIDGRLAIVIGLFGLDAADGIPATESHPVWAMAIDLGSMGGSINDDYWAMFARNWGNEGWCGDANHTIDFANNKVSFLLPWRGGATDVRVDVPTSDVKVKDAAGVVVEARPGVGVVVSNQLQAPSAEGWVEGTLHLVWTGGSHVALPPARPSTETERTPIEAIFKQQVVDHLPRDKLAQWNKVTAQEDADASLPADQIGKVTVHEPTEFLPPPPPKPVVHQLVNPERSRTNAARVAIVSSAYRGTFPWTIATTATPAPPRPAAEAPGLKRLTIIMLAVVAVVVVAVIIILARRIRFR